MSWSITAAIKKPVQELFIGQHLQVPTLTGNCTIRGLAAGLRRIATLAAVALTIFPNLSSSADTADMTFRLIGDASFVTEFFDPLSGLDPHFIYADGTITTGTADRFKAFVQAHHIPRGMKLYLNSPGGILGEGMNLGMAIRDAGLDTDIGKEAAGLEIKFGKEVNGGGPIPGECASACSLTFLGGIVRRVQSGSRFGVHRFYNNGQAQADDIERAQQASALIIAYIKAMGAKPELFDVWAQTPSSSMSFLTDAQLQALGVKADYETTFQLVTKGGIQSLKVLRTADRRIAGDIEFSCGSNQLEAFLRFHHLYESFKSSDKVRSGQLTWYIGGSPSSTEPVYKFITKPYFDIVRQEEVTPYPVSKFDVPNFQVVSIRDDELTLRAPVSSIIPLDVLLRRKQLIIASLWVGGTWLIEPPTISNEIEITDAGIPMSRKPPRRST